MIERMSRGKAALTALCAGLTGVFGWEGWLVLVWVAVMGADYLTGSLAACQGGFWSSSRARAGLWHKLGTIVAVSVSAGADALLSLTAGQLTFCRGWPAGGVLTPLVLCWYILTELGSIAENAVKMGAVLPGFLTRALSAARKSVENAAGPDTKDN